MTLFAVGAAYAPDARESFGVAEVGAPAALAGLLVVAASINLTRTLELPQAVSRLAKTLVLFATVLLVGSLLLAQGQTNHVLGAEMAVLGQSRW
jgi:hypothetical protein